MGQWDVGKLEENFIPMDVQAIRSIPIGIVNLGDYCAWHFEKSGLFTVRSCYRLLVSTRKVREDWLEERPTSSSLKSVKSWTKLWKVKVPSKVRVFARRLAQHSLPTGDVLQHRHMSKTSVCAICHADNDSWRHSLIDCTMAHCVWALADDQLTEHLCISVCPDAREWIFHLIDTTSHAEFTQILLTLWAIWLARRKAIHESIFLSPLSTHSFVIKLMAELQVDPDKTPTPVRTMPKPLPARWIPPPAGMFKINVDGGVAKTTNKGAFAAVCCHEKGNYYGSSARVFEAITDPPTLEALAICEALSLAKDLNIQKICVASDAQVVIEGLLHGTRCCYSPVLREVATRSKDFLDVSFVYESRVSNSDTRSLVKSSLS